MARLVGEVDLTRAPGIRVGLLRAVTNQDHGLVLDLRDTTYLDSAGVNVIFELAERLSARQQRLAAVVPDRAIIERVLDAGEPPLDPGEPPHAGGGDRLDPGARPGRAAPEA